MVHCLMRHEGLDAEIALVFVSKKDGVLGINVTTYKSGKALSTQMVFLDHMGAYVAAALDHADNRGFIRATPTLRLVATVLTARSDIPLARLSTDVGLVHFDDASEQFALRALGHRLAILHPHAPASVLVHFKIAGELASR